MRSFAVALVLIAVEGVKVRQSSELQSSANPIRKVVSMLQALQKKIADEEQKEQALFDKYMCYCKSSKSSLGENIEAANAKVPQLQADIEKGENQLKQMKADVVRAGVDREAAKASIATADALRKKEAETFAALKAEKGSDLAAMDKAIAALTKGMGGAFLQTSTASVIRRLVSKGTLPDLDQQQIMAFLSQSQNSAYAPASGEVVGLLKQMRAEMGSDFDAAEKQEEAAVADYNELVAAKKKEIATLSHQIETKTARSGDLGIEIERMRADLGSTQASQADDAAFLADLDKNCATKTAEWDDITKVRAEEKVAIADTINILNNDDALEIFKEAIPAASASFVQVQDRMSAVRARALALVHRGQLASGAPTEALNLLAMALHGQSKGYDFGKVIQMIDAMVANLNEEQATDSTKKEYCNDELDFASGKKQELERALSDGEAAMAKNTEDLAALADEVKKLQEGMKARDEQTAAATEQRQKENALYKDLMSSDAKAKKLIQFAVNRLRKFYQPALYKGPAKQVLSREDQIAVNTGLGTAPPTPAPGGIAGSGVTPLGSSLVQVSSHRQRAPEEAPEAPGAYSKKSQESTGILHMMDLLVQDLDKEMQEADLEEKDAQKDYEKLMGDSAELRAADASAVVSKSSGRADTEAELQKLKDQQGATNKELVAHGNYIKSLHGECDWLLQYFDARKEARTAEIDSLQSAKAVLSGADYSFIQLKSAAAPEDQLAKEMTHDLETNFNKIAPFGKEDTAKELQDHASKTQDTLVDAVENAEVAEIKRAVFRALTRLRAATIKEFDTIARLETQAIDAYNDAHHYRAENPLAHLHEDEAPVETDKLKSFH